MHIGKTIKKIRISKRLKQSAIADCMGISTTAYSDIEREKTLHISIQRLEQIAKALDVPVTEILSTDENSDALLKRIDDLKLELDYAQKELKNLRRRG
jgi:XRE family transcriptional regulator, regulator of sulfur utilization